MQIFEYKKERRDGVVVSSGGFDNVSFFVCRRFKIAGAELLWLFVWSLGACKIKKNVIKERNERERERQRERETRDRSLHPAADRHQRKRQPERKEWKIMNKKLLRVPEDTARLKNVTRRLKFWWYKEDLVGTKTTTATTHIRRPGLASE